MSSGGRVTPPEVWLRGPVPDVPALLQPVAHGLLQCREEVIALLPRLEADELWSTPGGAASIGYHVRHAIGSLDRLFTYARGDQLSDAQLAWLASERVRHDVSPAELSTGFHVAVERALDQLRVTTHGSLLEPREVGRGRLPSTVIGLLFHAAEHTQRHVGQLTTTAKVLRARDA